MTKVFAQVDDGTVTALLEGARAPDPEKLPAGRRFVEVEAFDEALLGATATVVDDRDVLTPAPPPADLGPALDARSFLLRFSDEERLAIREAALTDPLVADWLELAQLAGSVRLRAPETLAGLDLLTSKNLLATKRRDAIVEGA